MVGKTFSTYRSFIVKLVNYNLKRLVYKFNMNQKKKCLITSSNTKTWKFNGPIVFLGEWCKKYNKKNVWEKLDYVMPKPYGISLSQRDKDEKISLEIENNLIFNITNELNIIHKVNYNERMWTILLGPWIKRFSSLIVNRVHTLKKCMNEFQINETSLLYVNDEILIQKDSTSSVKAFNDNTWNQQLLYELFKIFDYKDIKIKLVKVTKKKPKPKPKYSFRLSIRFIINFFARYTNFLSTKNSIAIISLYINLWDLFNLSFYLNNFPHFRVRSQASKFGNSINLKLRNDLTKKIIRINKNSSTNDIAAFLLFKMLPRCYLEGFKELISEQSKTNFPLNPKYIVTSVGCDSDEVFKMWVVNKIITGSKLIIYQHGNNYGTHRYINNTIDEQISDKFITWGWKGNNKK